MFRAANEGKSPRRRPGDAIPGGGQRTGGVLETIAKAHIRLLNLMKTGSELIIFGVFVIIVVDVALTICAKWGLPVIPWDRTHGFVEYGLLWFTMLAAPWLARIKGHVFIDAVTQLLPDTARAILAKFAYCVVIVGCLAMTYFSAQLLLESIENEALDDRGADFILWTLYLPMPFGFGLVAIEFVRFLVGIDDMYGSRTDVREGI